MIHIPPTHWIRRLSGKSFQKKISRLPPREREACLALRLSCDPALFAHTALPAHCRLPFAPVHEMLFRWHMEMGRHPLPHRRGRRYALAAPRGSAKSTMVSLCLVLHDLIFQREEYILLLSATERQARQRLRAIRTELEEGLADLPGFLHKHRERHFTVQSLTLSPVQIEAYGAGTEIRGITSHGYRPTKIILDDAEASSAARSIRARERLAEWFAEIVEHLGDVYTNVIAIGTILHERSLLSDLLQRPDFETHRARSIERFSSREDLWGDWRRLLLNFSDPHRRDTAREFFRRHVLEMTVGTEVLWPEKEDYEDLMAQLTLQGRRAFYQEKQNTPLGSEDALFETEALLYGTVADGILRIASRAAERERIVREYTRAGWDTRRFGYLDASLGKGRQSGRGDFAALAIVLLLPDKSLFLERLWARRLPPTRQVKRLYDAHEDAPFELLAIEGTGFQELLMLPIEEERKRRLASGRAGALPTQVVHPRKSKGARIGALEPLLSNGTLALAPNLDEEFWEELTTWPRCRHDDALDAAAGAVELALSHARDGGKSWKRSDPRRMPRSPRF